MQCEGEARLISRIVSSPLVSSFQKREVTGVDEFVSHLNQVRLLDWKLE